jgi:hypothetical protein
MKATDGGVEGSAGTGAQVPLSVRSLLVEGRGPAAMDWAADSQEGESNV